VSVKLLTWNINGLDPELVDERTEVAVFTSIIGTTLNEVTKGAKPWPPPDVICYQEVTSHTYGAHVKPHLEAGGYVVVPTSIPERQNFEIIAVRSPYVLRSHTESPLVDSVYGRVLHVVEVDGPLGTIRVATGHFDSGTEAKQVRIAQLHQVVTALGKRGVFLGDANMRKAEWLEQKSDVSIVDAWEEVGEPAATRYTWFRNEMKARFDRVWVTPELRAAFLKPVGDKNIEGLRTRPSDHIGLLVTLADSASG
jgi:endonuclease/exonuclease/phosphatase family metal-dependent hydrolase